LRQLRLQLDNPTLEGSPVNGASGNGYTNNRIFASASDNQTALGVQNTAVGNAANQYKLVDMLILLTQADKVFMVQLIL
jgi:hypothetical protein